MPIQKLAAKIELEIGNEKCIAADSKIGNQTMPLSIKKSKAKNCVAADSEIDSNGGVISALLLFFLGVYIG